MTKHFSTFDDVIADEQFFAWYTNTDSTEAKAWQDWLSKNPHYQPLVNESIQHLNALILVEKPISDKQTEYAHSRLLLSINKKTTPVFTLSRKKNLWWLSAAAVLLLVIGALILGRTSTGGLKLNTEYGQVAQYKLPDGSEVMLNANSKLSIKRMGQKGSDREVWLEGEAFFHVKNTTEKNRFIVHTKDVDIIVTGTQFNVVNREGENNVLLTEGSVTLVTKEGKKLKMVPGDFVKLNNPVPKKEAAPTEKILAWKQSKLVFENTEMTEAAKTISRHYGVKVMLDKEVGDKKITGILPNNNLEELLKALEATMDFKITRTPNQIVITNIQQ